MLISKLQHVIPLQPSYDYSDWHKGRLYFSIWYIELTCPHLITYCHSIRQQCLPLLDIHYQRQFHITLFVNGFWSKERRFSDDFLPEDLQRQVDQLHLLSLSPFSLTLTGLDSFTNCLFLNVDDPYGQLERIRQVFADVHPEISPAVYYPHVTLGFYRQAFLGDQVLKQIKQTVWQPKTFEVTQLKFGMYHASELQGRLCSHLSILLS